MHTPSPTPHGPPPVEAESADLFDYRLIRDYAGYVLGSVRRHRLLAVLVFASTVGLSVAAAWLWPRTWHVESTLLAQRNLTIAMLGNPGRSIPWDDNAPTYAARERVLRRDNLVNLVKQTQLIQQWEATRAPVLRLKDTLTGLFRRPLTDEEKVDVMVWLLEKELSVTTDQGTVTLGVDWPDGTMAYRLVEAAQQNFLEARHVEETSVIADAISILESHAQSVEASLKEAFEVVMRLQTQSASGATRAPAIRSVARAPDREKATEQQLTQLRLILEAKRRSVSDLEEFRRRRLAELQSTLAEQRVIYSAQHPLVLDTEQRIHGLNEDSPQLVTLKRDVEALEQEYQRLSGEALASSSRAAPRAVGTDTVATVAASRTGDDPEMEYARNHLRLLMAKHQELTLRVDSARIELDTARAAFKYRYTVVRPAQLPKQPVKPNTGAIVGTGVVAAVLLAVFAAVLKSLVEARVVERWQVERVLRLPVLAEVRGA